MEIRKRETQIKFYKDAPDATVAVETATNLKGEEQLLLRINGKSDASTYGDLCTQYLLGHLPMMARPDAKDVFILGFGSGITGGAILGHPVESLTIAENCAPVIEASKLFEPWNRGVLTNARTNLRRDDARTVLKLSEKKYDVIISEPSNPWVAGIGSVFSQEFYQLCDTRLKDGGVMAQWFHMYEMNDGIVDLVLSTFTSVFPHMEVWDTQAGDIVLVGSKQPWESTPAVFQKVFEREQPRQDLERIGIHGAVAVMARQLASQRTSYALRSGTAIQTDEFPVLEYTAPQAFFIGYGAERIFKFDERTRQQALAPEVKRRTLRALPEPMLQAVYNEYGSANNELLTYVRWRGQNVLKGNHPRYENEPNMPVIYRPVESYWASTNATELGEKLAAMEVEFLTNSEKAPGAIQEITRILEAEERFDKKRKWNPTTFAASAARWALSRGDVAEATKLIELGSKFDRGDEELGYLKRLIDGRPKSVTTNVAVLN
jgi:spermidine synthase